VVQGLGGPSVTSSSRTTSIYFMPYTEHPLLTQDIQLLSLSGQIKKLLAKAGIKTFKQLLNIPMHHWQTEVDGLTDRQWKKLVSYVVWHGIDDSIRWK
jgi:hypothetical protein